jgi:hypothetical protein
MEDVPGQGEHEHNEGKERKNDVGGHAEGVGVHLCLCKIERERLRPVGQGGMFPESSEGLGSGTAGSLCSAGRSRLETGAGRG